MPNTFLKWAFFTLKDYKWPLLLTFFLASLTGVYGTFISYLIKVLIDTLVNLGTSQAPSVIIKSSIIPAILFVLNYEIHDLLWRGVEYINLKIAPKIKNHVITQTFNYIHQHAIQFFQANFSGALSNNILLLVDNLERILHNSFLFVLTTSVQLIVALVAMYSVNIIFSIALLSWVVLFLIVRLSLVPRAKILSQDYAQSHSLVSGKLVDSFQGIGLVRLFSRELFESAYLSNYLNKMQDKFVIKESFVWKIALIQGLSISVLITFMLFFLVELRSQNLVSIGDFALILGSVLTVTKNMWTLTKHIDTINDCVGKCNQSLTVLLAPLEKNNQEQPDLIVSQGQVEFQNVYFQYPGAEPLFCNQSLKILPRQKIGLVGYSGSGKTTFVNLILRLFEINEGAILIDNQNIKAVNIPSLRNNISMVSQESILFHRSIRDNICYGLLTASDFEVIEAAKRAQIHDFIASLPLGYHTMVGEQGVRLSGGQRQRLCIARAILKNAPILILDEATSQLDSLTEKELKMSLEAFIKNKTTLIITHKLSTLVEMDQILVFNQGQIVQKGLHEALVNQQGLYKQLWEAQKEGMLPQENTQEMQEKSVFALDYE